MDSGYFEGFPDIWDRWRMIAITVSCCCCLFFGSNYRVKDKEKSGTEQIMGDSGN